MPAPTHVRGKKSVEVPAEALAEAFQRVWRQIRHESHRRISPLGLNLHESRALRVVGEHGPLRPSELAAHLRISPRSATDSVAGLIASGLIERCDDPADGRAHLLTLSESGVSTLEAVRRARQAAGEEVFSRLPADDRQTLLSLLDQLG